VDESVVIGIQMWTRNRSGSGRSARDALYDATT
jgi:hypothetical protein